MKSKGWRRISLLALFLAIGLSSVQSVHAQFEFRGLMDLVIADDDDARFLNWPRTGDSATDPLHTRLFFEGGSERTRAFVQLILRDTSGSSIRTYGAYALHQVFEQHSFYVQAGKIPTPQGTWGPRTYADKNPLIGGPLMYVWANTLPTTQMPEDLDALVAVKGTGPLSPVFTDGTDQVRGARGPQMTVLYDNCWNDGIAVLGIARGIEYQFAATLGSPGAPVNGVDVNDETALHARLGWAPIPEVVLRISWGRGAYLNRVVEPFLPAGRSVNDYRQQLWLASVELSSGRWVFHAEGVVNHLETPLTSDALSSSGFYADLAWKFAVGWSAAVRFDTLRHGDVESSSGDTSWDQDVSRWEAGVSYDVSRDLVLKAVVQTTDVGNGFESDTTVPALQAVVRF